MKYFAYGSNMLAERLRAPDRVPSARNPIVVPINGYRLCFNKRSIDGSGKCNLVGTSSSADHVFGVIYDIDETEIDALDRAEGRGNGYDRKEFWIRIEGTPIKTFIYLATRDAVDDSLLPYDWYRDLVLAGAEQHKLPSKYVSYLQSFNPKTDTNLNRTTRLEAIAILRKYAESKTLLS